MSKYTVIDNNANLGSMTRSILKSNAMIALALFLYKGWIKTIKKPTQRFFKSRFLCVRAEGPIYWQIT